MPKPKPRLKTRRLTPAGKKNLVKRQKIININLALLKKLKLQAAAKKRPKKMQANKKIISKNKRGTPSIESDYARLKELGISDKAIEKLGNEDYIHSMISLDLSLEAKKSRKKKK